MNNNTGTEGRVSEQSSKEKYWTLDEVKQILEAANAPDKPNTRLENRGLALCLTTIFYTGRRVGEVIGMRPIAIKQHQANNKPERIINGLCPRDLDTNLNGIWFSVEKKRDVKQGDRRRFIEAPTWLINKLLDYTKEYNIQPNQRIFPYNSTTIDRKLKEAIKRAGINKQGSVHWLRHSWATYILNETGDIAYTAEILAHEKYDLVSTYARSHKKYRELLFKE